MSSKVISIEIGDSLTRVLEADYKAKTHKAYGYFTIPTPEGAVSDGALAVTPKYIEALRSAITQHRMKAKKIVFSITSSRISSREAVIPHVKENRVGDVVNAIAPDYFPVDLSQYQLAYYALGTVGGAEEIRQYRVLIFAAPTALLEGYYDLAKALKLDVAAIDYVGNSVFQVAKNKVGAGTGLVVKMEGHFALAMVVCDGMPVFTRNIPYGVKDGIESMLGSIARVVDYYVSTRTDTSIAQAYLTGSRANTEGIADEFARELGIPAEILGNVPGWNLEKNFKMQFYGEYIACIGAAASPLGFQKEGKKKYWAGKGSMNSALAAYALLAAGLVSSVLLILFSAGRYTGLKKQNAELKAVSREMESVIPVYDEYTQTQASYRLTMSMYAATQNRNEGLVDFLEELERRMPAGVRIVSMTSTEEGVTINMNAGTKSEAALAIEQLRSFGSLNPDSVTVSNIVEETDGETGGGYVNFAVTAVYKDIRD